VRYSDFGANDAGTNQFFDLRIDAPIRPMFRSLCSPFLWAAISFTPKQLFQRF
jgi:hypothetical protein